MTDLLGIGMGSPKRSRMVAKLVVPNANDVVDLYGQMAAKEYNGVRYVRFIYGDKTYEQIQPETDLGDTGRHLLVGGRPGRSEAAGKPFVKGRWFLHKGMKKMKLPRAYVMYATYDSGSDEYANAWSTFGAQDNFVAGTPGFDQTNSNYLAIPETQAVTDIVVQVAVTDVNRDARTVDVTVKAGGVEETVTLTSPTTKKSELLNIFEVTLPNVPAGVSEVEILMESVLDEGDSAALLGAAARYFCEPPRQSVNLRLFQTERIKARTGPPACPRFCVGVGSIYKLNGDDMIPVAVTVVQTLTLDACPFRTASLPNRNNSFKAGTPGVRPSRGTG